MKNFTPKKIPKSKPNVSEISNRDDYKRCSSCGQSKFPFRYGVCICGKQVGDIQYVQNPQAFVKNYYSYIGSAKKQNSYKYDTAVEETFAVIEEVEIND